MLWAVSPSGFQRFSTDVDVGHAFYITCQLLVIS
jgi:hypothetical protein